MCDKIVCVCDKVVGDKVVLDIVVRDQVVCDKVMCVCGALCKKDGRDKVVCEIQLYVKDGGVKKNVHVCLFGCV